MKKLLLITILFFTFIFANDNQSGYVKSSGTKIYYEVIGEGEPLVLLHGGLGPGGHYKRNIPEFQKHFQLITIHTRGHGKSSDNDQPFSYASFADDVNNVLEHLEINSTNVIGFSDGGVIGYQLVAKYPERVNKLIAVGANTKVEGLTVGTIDWTKNSLSPKYVAENMPDIKKTYTTLNPNPENFDNYINKTQEIWLRDPYVKEEKFKTIKSPVLILGGDNDAINLEHFIEMHHLLDNSQLCIIPDATHFVLSEKPEVVNEICVEFLLK